MLDKIGENIFVVYLFYIQQNALQQLEMGTGHLTQALDTGTQTRTCIWNPNTPTTKTPVRNLN